MAANDVSKCPPGTRFGIRFFRWGLLTVRLSFHGTWSASCFGMILGVREEVATGTMRWSKSARTCKNFRYIFYRVAYGSETLWVIRHACVYVNRGYVKQVDNPESRIFRVSGARLHFACLFFSPRSRELRTPSSFCPSPNPRVYLLRALAGSLRAVDAKISVIWRKLRNCR